MGIQIEFNPDLALRNWSAYEAGKRKREECIPEDLAADAVYEFLKKDHRNYWLKGEIPLLETAGGEQLSRPKASVVILEATHFLDHGEAYTRGRYKVIEVFKDDAVYFESYARVK